MIYIQKYFNDIHKSEFSFIKLTSFEDMSDIIKFQEERFNADLKNTQEHDKPSHLWCQTTVAHLARAKMSFEFDLDDTQRKDPDFFKKLSNLAFSISSDLYFDSIRDELSRSGVCYINEVGGIYVGEPLDDSSTYLIDEHVFSSELMQTKNLFLVENSTCLILENDPVLDKWTINNISEPYSYLLNLRNCMQSGLLKQYLKEYISFTESTDFNLTPKILIYTTGSDTKQMYDYMDIISTLRGINEVEFIFADGSSDYLLEHRKIIEKYSSSSLTISHNLKD